MKVTVLAATVDERLMEALAEAGIEASHALLPEGGEASATAGLALALRGAEDALDGPRCDAAVVVGGGDEALAALVTAVKLRVPVAWLGAPDGDGDLLARVADLRLDATDDAEVLATSIRELAAPNINGS